jgi:heat shock protein HslJ
MPLLCGLAALVISACSDDESSPLLGKSYLLESSEGFKPVGDSGVRLTFTQDGAFGLRAGCNGMSGEFSVEGGRLLAKNLSATTIGCDVVLHQQDEWLAAFMESRPELTLDGDRLTLQNEEATLNFLDREVANPDRSLVGTSWTVTTLITGEVAEGSVIDPPPTLLFTDKGELEIFTSCNEGSGRYEQNGDTLTLSQLQYTDQACSDVQGRFDRHIQAVLTNGEVNFVLDEQTLDLTRGQQGLGAFAP